MKFGENSGFKGMHGRTIKYRNNSKYWDRYAFANCVDPDQTPQNAASDQGLHSLPYIQQYFRLIKKLCNGLFQNLEHIW